MITLLQCRTVEVIHCDTLFEYKTQSVTPLRLPPRPYLDSVNAIQQSPHTDCLFIYWIIHLDMHWYSCATDPATLGRPSPKVDSASLLTQFLNRIGVIGLGAQAKP